jgi:hypothetical protein
MRTNSAVVANQIAFGIAAPELFLFCIAFWNLLYANSIAPKHQLSCICLRPPGNSWAMMVLNPGTPAHHSSLTHLSRRTCSERPSAQFSTLLARALSTSAPLLNLVDRAHSLDGTVVTQMHPIISHWSDRTILQGVAF